MRGKSYRLSLLKSEHQQVFSEALSIQVDGISQSAARQVLRMLDPTSHFKNLYLKMIQDSLTKPLFNMKMTPY